MPRPNRIIAPGVPHHITQRGNYRQTVFHRNEDRHFYLNLLEEFLPHYGVSLQAYCLLSNHVHLVATPHEAKGLSRALQRIHSEYARGLHLRLRQTGHLWQARYHSVALDEKHFLAAMLYVERNPVRARLVKHPAQWRWSSAPTHLGLVKSSLLDQVRWRCHFDASRWERWLSGDAATVVNEERIREATLAGYPLGDDLFKEDLRTRLHLPTEPGKPGRPRKVPACQSLPLTAAEPSGV